MKHRSSTPPLRLLATLKVPRLPSEVYAALTCAPLMLSACGDGDGENNPASIDGRGETSSAVERNDVEPNEPRPQSSNEPAFELVDEGPLQVELADGQVCAEQSADAQRVPTTLLFVVDVSGSMNDEAPGSLGRSKWEVTRDAMTDAIDRLSPDTSVGMVMFPGTGPMAAGPVDTCFVRQEMVEIAPLDESSSAQRQRIADAFSNTRPGGGTPTHDAYRYALSRLDESAAGAVSIVLITDGVPTFSLGCEGTGRLQDAVDPGPLVDEATLAFDAGVLTFVIGSPGSEQARRSLSQMAHNGGTGGDACETSADTPCHLDMTQQVDLAAGLATALEQIAVSSTSCVFDVPSPPSGGRFDANQVDVLLTLPDTTEELIVRSSGSDCTDGWRYSEDQSQILLCSQTCARTQSSLAGVRLRFACTTDIH